MKYHLKTIILLFTFFHFLQQNSSYTHISFFEPKSVLFDTLYELDQFCKSETDGAARNNSQEDALQNLDSGCYNGSNYFNRKIKADMVWDDVFGKRLSALRKNMKISAREMSLSLGQNPSYINSIETGRAYPTMANFFQICEYLEISPRDFFDSRVQDPKKTDGFIDDIRKLNPRQMELLHQIIGEMKH